MNTFKLAAVLIAVLLLPNVAASADAATDAITKGDSLMEKADYDAAIAAFNEAIRIDPKNAVAYSDRGRAEDYKGDHDKAIADNTEAIRLDPKFLRAYSRRGFAYQEKGDQEKANVDFAMATRLNPKNAAAFTSRGNVFALKGEYDKAIGDYSEAIRLDPKDAKPYYFRGYAYTKKADQDKAIADYSEAIRLSPKGAIAHTGRGFAYGRKGEYDKEIADCTEAIRLNGKYDAAYCDRGYAYAEKGDYDKAIADYSEAIRLNPKDAATMCQRGWAYGQKGDYDKAIADLDPAVSLNPKTFSYREVRGTMRIRRGDYDGGIADLQAAIRLDPNDPAAKFETGSKEPLTAAALQHGEQQVTQMLRDRPAMTQFGEKARILCQWAARKFAGEDLRERIIWDASEPELTDADSCRSMKEGPGQIRIRRRYREGVDKGKERSFDALWTNAVFELYNVANANDFQRIDDEAVAGKLPKETYVLKTIECESRAAEKTRAFYIHVFLPWAKEQHASTDPRLWYIGHRSDSRENIASHVDKRWNYWKHYERSYDTLRIPAGGLYMSNISGPFFFLPDARPIARSMPGPPLVPDEPDKKEKGGK